MNLERYRLMLVDDEEEARRAIVNKLNWSELGFEVVGEASNGEEALELCEMLRPDIIMTDIRMPFMDGLTLCRRAKQMLPRVKTAIFSGFDEFEYAKEAIKLEVEEYILKPISADELKQVFLRIKSALDKEAAEIQNIERLRLHYEQSLPVLRQQLLSDLLDGRAEANRVLLRLKEYGVDMAAESYCVAVMRYEMEAIGADMGLHAYSLQNMVANVLNGVLPCQMLPSLERLVLLFQLPVSVAPQEVAGHLNAMFTTAQRLLGMRLSIGLGRLCEQPQNISRSYAEALDALEYQNLMEAGQCIYVGDIKPSVVESDFRAIRHIDEIVRQVKIGRREDLRASFEELRQYADEKHVGRAQQQVLQLGITTQLLTLIKDYELERQAAEISETLLEKSVRQLEGMGEMLHMLEQVCETLRVTLLRERGASSKKLVETARQYIETNYDNSDLSVDDLCGVLNVSPAYFSTLFKKETGESFVAYLTRLRMERAVEYLGSTDDKTYQIAERAGYADPNYFSYVFKRYYGVSPSKYRAERIEDHEPRQ